jgi:thiamine biosynthesis lipoprotein
MASPVFAEAMQRAIGAVLVVSVAMLVAFGQWRIAKKEASEKIAVVARPQGVMGTDCTLAVVVTRDQVQQAQESLQRAETVIRGIEARMSSWLHESEISRCAASASRDEVPLSADTLAVLRAARDAFDLTGGTFDVTCRPQIQLWWEAVQRGEVPDREQCVQARQASHWDLVEWTANGIRKRADSLCFDLGGIAKGYAIDRALDALRGPEVHGAMVDIGGDLACTGLQADGRAWHVDVRDPQQSEALLRLQMADLSVATSGNYARYLTIDGRRYSHIIDPRSSLPADHVVSVTVISATAQAADIWATALSVLGSDGLAMLPENVDALLVVVGQDGESSLTCTRGFADHVVGPLPQNVSVWEPGTLAAKSCRDAGARVQ